MKPSDLKQRGVKLKQMEHLYGVHGIKFIRFAVNDLREQDLASNLFQAAQHLNSMINTLGLNVFVFCNSGLSRSPAVVLTYLSLFKQHRSWDSVEDLYKFLKSFNNKIKPNLKAVQTSIEAHRDF